MFWAPGAAETARRRGKHDAAANIAARQTRSKVNW